MTDRRSDLAQRLCEVVDESEQCFPDAGSIAFVRGVRHQRVDLEYGCHRYQAGAYRVEMTLVDL